LESGCPGEGKGKKERLPFAADGRHDERGGGEKRGKCRSGLLSVRSRKRLLLSDSGTGGRIVPDGYDKEACPQGGGGKKEKKKKGKEKLHPRQQEMFPTIAASLIDKGKEKEGGREGNAPQSRQLVFHWQCVQGGAGCSSKRGGGGEEEKGKEGSGVGDRVWSQRARRMRASSLLGWVRGEKKKKGGSRPGACSTASGWGKFPNSKRGEERGGRGSVTYDLPGRGAVKRDACVGARKMVGREGRGSYGGAPSGKSCMTGLCTSAGRKKKREGGKEQVRLDRFASKPRELRTLTLLGVSPHGRKGERGERAHGPWVCEPRGLYPASEKRRGHLLERVPKG